MSVCAFVCDTEKTRNNSKQSEGTPGSKIYKYSVTREFETIQDEFLHLMLVKQRPVVGKKQICVTAINRWRLYPQLHMISMIIAERHKMALPFTPTLPAADHRSIIFVLRSVNTVSIIIIINEYD